MTTKNPQALPKPPIQRPSIKRQAALQFMFRHVFTAHGAELFPICESH